MRFDQRPGFLEATAGTGRLVVVGRNAPQGLRVVLLRGGIEVAALGLAEAMALSIDLSAVAETLHALASGEGVADG